MASRRKSGESSLFSLLLDSGIIFQKLTAICSDDGLNDALKHEQVHYHMSLFNDQKFM